MAGDGPWMAMESIDVSHVCRFLDCEMDVTHCESSFIRWGVMIVFSATKARLIVFVCLNLWCRQTFFDEEQGQHLKAGTALA